MGYQVPERVIKLLCGNAAFDQGAAYYHAHKVDLVYTEHNEEDEYSKYRAEVHGLDSHEIALIIDSDGDVQGECTCPAYYHGGPFCKHIAAALVAVLYRSRTAGAEEAEEMQADAGRLIPHRPAARRWQRTASAPPGQSTGSAAETGSW